MHGTILTIGDRSDLILIHDTSNTVKTISSPADGSSLRCKPLSQELDLVLNGTLQMIKDFVTEEAQDRSVTLPTGGIQRQSRTRTRDSRKQPSSEKE